VSRLHLIACQHAKVWLITPGQEARCTWSFRGPKDLACDSGHRHYAGRERYLDLWVPRTWLALREGVLDGKLRVSGNEWLVQRGRGTRFFVEAIPPVRVQCRT
jgi:hypothetical protein